MDLKVLSSVKDLVNVDLDGSFSNAPACFLVGGSPKLNEVDLEAFNYPGVLSMAMNNVATKFKPTMWLGADKAQGYSPSILLDPTFMKFTYISRVDCKVNDAEWKDLPNTYFIGSDDKMRADRFFEPHRDFIWWKNVFMLSLQVLYRLGFRKVFTVGCEFRINQKYQYAYDTAMSDKQINYNQRTYSMVVDQLKSIQPHAKKVGFEVISCTPDSKINDFVPYLDFDKAIKYVTEQIPTHDTGTSSHPLVYTKDNTRGFEGKWAEGWDRVEFLEDLIKYSGSESVVEYNCDNGENCEAFDQDHYLGVDYNKANVLDCQKAYDAYKNNELNQG